MSGKFEGFDFFVSQIKPSLKELTHYHFYYLLNQYQQIINHADRHLIEAARRHDNEAGKTAFITAIEQCQHMQKAMVSAFGHCLLEALKTFNGNLDQHGGILYFNYSLTADELHARPDLAYLANITQELCDQHAQSINKLSSLINPYLDRDLNKDNSPLSPNMISHAIFTSLNITNMPSGPKKELFVLFNSELLQNLDDFYKSLFTLLGEDPHSQALTSSIHPYWQTHSSAIDTIESEFNTLINEGNIPASLAADNIITGRMGDETNSVSLKMIDDALADMQRGYDPISDGPFPAFFTAQLQTAATSSPLSLKRNHANILHLISLILDNIANIQPEPISDLFLRLKTPYARIALNDSLFFHDQTHIARLLLEQLLELSYSSDNSELLYKQLQTIILKLLIKYQGDSSVFIELSNKVTNYQTENKAAFSLSQKKLRSQLETEERAQQAYLAVKAYIHKRSKPLKRKLRFHVLSEIIMTDILTNILIVDTNESARWRHGIKILDIIYILTSYADDKHFSKLALELPAVARTLSKFFSDNDLNDSTIRVFLQQFNELHHVIKEGTALSKIDDDELSHTFAIDMIIDHYESERVADINTATIGYEHAKHQHAGDHLLVKPALQPSLKNAKALAAQLPLGQWLSFVIDKKRTPCFAAYFSKPKQSFVFCDRHNQKLFERSRDEIAKDIASGFACPLSHALCFEGNLSQVMENLMHRH